MLPFSFFDGAQNITSDSHEQPVLRKWVCVGHSLGKKGVPTVTALFSHLLYAHHVHTFHTSPSNQTPDAYFTFILFIP